MQETENRPSKTRNRGNIGKANLYNVISYGSKNSFVKDENKHFAGSNYDKPKYGFLVNQAKRFDVPIPIRGKLGFFDVELNGFRLLGQVQRTLEIFHAKIVVTLEQNIGLLPVILEIMIVTTRMN